MRITRRRLGVAAALVVIGLVLPVVVVGVANFGDFDIFGHDDPLGVEGGRQDMIDCLRPGLSRFQPNDVVEAVLVFPQPDGSEASPPGVDGWGYAASSEDESATTVLEIDFYSNAKQQDKDRLEAALRERDEVVTVLRDARASDCQAATSTTS